jgi:hypothetical protein
MGHFGACSVATATAPTKVGLPLDDLKQLGNWYSSFSRKRSKKRCSASQKVEGPNPSAKRNHGGLGACPNKPIDKLIASFAYQKKKQEA